jgi:hypothetical protein
LKWFYEYLRRFQPAEHYGAASMEITRRRSARETRLDGDQARTEELNKLRLAMATFAVQLDMFEMRMREGPLRALSIKTGTRDPPSDTVDGLPNKK